MKEFSYEQAFLFNTGSDIMSYNLLGSHRTNVDQVDGYAFAVWAPIAKSVSVVGDFNSWDATSNVMERMGETGIFYGFVPSAVQWQRYKYSVTGSTGDTILKADPYAVHSETRQGTSSVLYCLDDGFDWTDDDFIQKRESKTSSDSSFGLPLNIYEVHLGSWKKYPDGSFYNYQTLAHELAAYVKEMGYTHIELLPVMEHPLDDSWGYQVTGFFSPTSRFGTPFDFKYFVNHMHEQGIGVILDWVPGHFPKDSFGLARFDGSAVFEYADDRIGEHKEWGTYVFNYSRSEVRSFLISNAVYWMDFYHIDGIRVDAVSSMLYLNYGRTNFMRNIHGGVENLEAISFLQQLNTSILNKYPGVMMIAEESTSWPKVTASTSEGGLGFTHKWNMGWMHDTVEYFSRDYIFRKWHQAQLSFSLVYAFSEKFILPLSHDEIVHGKASMIGKMPGDLWRKFASLRTLYAYMIAHPGGKLLFMGSEFGQFIEWRFKEQLEWFMLEHEQHARLHTFVKKLNHVYLKQKSLWEQDQNWDGFHWHSADDSENSIFIFSRISVVSSDTDPSKKQENILVVLNMVPQPMEQYQIGVQNPGEYEVILDTDYDGYGGSGYLLNYYKDRTDVQIRQITDSGGDSIQSPVFTAYQESWGGFPYSLKLPIPPLSALYLKNKN